MASKEDCDGGASPGHFTAEELRSAILLAILAFAIYPALPAQPVELTGFLGGLVNSTVTVAEMANRVRESDGRMLDVACGMRHPSVREDGP